MTNTSVTIPEVHEGFQVDYVQVDIGGQLHGATQEGDRVNNKKNKKKPRKPANSKIRSGYNLRYLSRWRSRMVREGVKEAADRKRSEEDNASSALMRLFLSCGKSTGRDRNEKNANLS